MMNKNYSEKCKKNNRLFETTEKKERFQICNDIFCLFSQTLNEKFLKSLFTNPSKLVVTFFLGNPDHPCPDCSNNFTDWTILQNELLYYTNYFTEQMMLLDERKRKKIKIG